MKIAIIGQSPFATEVYRSILKDGHKIAGIFTVMDKNGKQDPVAIAGEKDGIPVFKLKSWRRKGEAIPEVLEQYKSVGADLNVMPYCSQFIPMEVLNYPKHKSICYHPSILPRHRGASAISWTLIEGDTRGGFTIFYPDDGLDTGDILLTRECDVSINDTVDSLYNGFMYPEGIKAMAEAVRMIDEKRAPVIKQPEVGASYDQFLNKPEFCKVNLQQPARSIHNFIRGLDSSPGAWTLLDGKETKMFGSRLWHLDVDEGRPVQLDGGANGRITQDGLMIQGTDGKWLLVKLLSVEGKFQKAESYGLDTGDQEEIIPTDEEKDIVEKVRGVWAAILKSDVADDTDFFGAGAGSMDVVRLIEEVKEASGLALVNEDVFMATKFDDFSRQLVIKLRGGGGKKVQEYTTMKMHVNKMDISFPTQLYIDGEFRDCSNGKMLTSINPHDESVICKVQSASKEDVDTACKAAYRAFKHGEWGKMNARDRGALIMNLANLMDEHKEELATIESIDSGAVYTLALKTHVGMSIDTWKYFAGWCDKIEGSTIPINNARPNRNLTITKKEPIGVCGLVTPWNYPLMMLSWKMAACLAAGNTVVIKPAQVSPLTALKFAELSLKAGIPPGVINVLPGTGSQCGQAIADHPLVRKLGFTGSTEIGHKIMSSCAMSNLKKCSLELGGKSPLIIFADCDMEKAVKNALGSVFFNKGENCIAAGRIFVEETIYDQFLDRVVEETKKMKIGDPLDRSTQHGPQNHLAHLNKLVEYCELAEKEGCKLLLGGKKVDGPGLYMEPTVYCDVQDHMYVAKEESFGPIMLVSKFDAGDVEGVVERANNVEYGLASGVFTKDINKALYVSENIEAGTCFVNIYNKTDVAAPFGGFKRSGFGKDLGKEALNEYLKTKTVTFEFNL
eukprot:TRINITY_DN6060_c0_g1_i13.p1 TRINITY_DN6060_c0_g1~~TRINITY_DN6060_c0_g1_i13.p1  ORF type:complete len:901 (-),score=295.69 TRINITY_DN6060_c0_g1_i13:194-2896(-)